MLLVNRETSKGPATIAVSLLTWEISKGPETIAVSLETEKTSKGSLYLDIINDTKLIKALSELKFSCNICTKKIHWSLGDLNPANIFCKKILNQ